MSQYPLSIITPNGKVFEGLVESLIAPGAGGFFGVLSGHAAMSVSLVPGPVTIKVENTQRYYAISSGTLEVSRQNKVVLLSDLAVEKPSIQEAKQHSAASVTR